MFSYTLSGIGATPGIAIYNGFVQGYRLPPAIGVLLSDGAVLTYNVEATLDNLQGTNFFPASTTWIPFDGMNQQTASNTATLGARVSGLRCRITAYTSGSLIFQVTP